MLHQRDAHQVLDRDFFELRAKILEIAAGLDRIDRAPIHHGEHPDARLGHVRQALEMLLTPGPDRAESVQLIFSLEYDDAWRRNFGLAQPERS